MATPLYKNAVGYIFEVNWTDKETLSMPKNNWKKLDVSSLNETMNENVITFNTLKSHNAYNIVASLNFTLTFDIFMDQFDEVHKKIHEIRLKTVERSMLFRIGENDFTNSKIKYTFFWGTFTKIDVVNTATDIITLNCEVKTADGQLHFGEESTNTDS